MFLASVPAIAHRRIAREARHGQAGIAGSWSPRTETLPPASRRAPNGGPVDRRIEMRGDEPRGRCCDSHPLDVHAPAQPVCRPLGIEAVPPPPLPLIPWTKRRTDHVPVATRARGGPTSQACRAGVADRMRGVEALPKSESGTPSAPASPLEGGGTGSPSPSSDNQEETNPDPTTPRTPYAPNTNTPH